MTHPYATLSYAESLYHWGEPHWVEAWNTPVILRDIDGTHLDASGVYPITILPADINIESGINALKKSGAVSAVLVLDDFHRPEISAIEPHVAFIKPFKTHYVFKPSLGAISYSSHHARALKKAQKNVRVDILDLSTHWSDWKQLYDHLIAQLSLTGLHAFDKAHHKALANIEGFTAIGAWSGDTLVSAHIWAYDDTSAHSHLVASNEVGYELRAGFAVNDFSLQHFADKDIINFGGGAGVEQSDDDGLARFKKDFSNNTAQSYLCGIILNEEKYAQLSTNKQTEFFPAYRG